MAIITTIYGDTDEAELVKTEGSVDTPTEATYWVEYRHPGSDEIVHRSVYMILKELPASAAVEPGKL